jgi:thiamine-monophosphate kinase
LSSNPASDAALRVRDLGEFGLIERLQARIAARANVRFEPRARAAAQQLGTLELSIGDDAAVWRPRDAERQVITTDALVENVHFRLSTTSWRDLGWKSLAVNVSDLAAMAATPRYALITLGLPGDTLVAEVIELYEGMLDLAEKFAVDLIGGDLVSAPCLMLNVTAIGEAAGELLRRDAGKVGDLLAVTGTLGASVGGLRLLEAGRADDAFHQSLLSAHLRPLPRVTEAAALVEAGLRCGMDLSDGLLGDTAHLCEQSRLGAVIDLDAVPAHPALQAEFGPQTLPLALAGGEDYELLCAGPAESIEQAQRLLRPLGTPLTVVGRLIERSPGGPLVRVVDRSGQPVEPPNLSWDHFRG